MSPPLMCLEWHAGSTQEEQAGEATVAEMQRLLAAAGSSSPADVEAAVLPHFSHASLMAALMRAVAQRNVPAAACLLRRTRELPRYTSGQFGSLDLAREDSTLAAAVRYFVDDGGLAAVGGWGDWSLRELHSFTDWKETAAALRAGGVTLPQPWQPPPPALPKLHQILESPDFGTASRMHEATQLLQLEWWAAVKAGGRVAQSAVAVDAHGRTALHVVVESPTDKLTRRDAVHLARHLLQTGASAAAVDSEGVTPLMRLLVVATPPIGEQWRDDDELAVVLYSPESAAVPYRGLTPVQLCVTTGRFTLLKAMASMGVPVMSSASELQPQQLEASIVRQAPQWGEAVTRARAFVLCLQCKQGAKAGSFESEGRRRSGRLTMRLPALPGKLVGRICTLVMLQGLEIVP